MCTPSNMVCRNYEKDLKKYVLQEELQEEIIYLNLTEEESANYATAFNEKYSSKIKLTNNYPALIIFEDGRVTHLLQGKEKLTITKTKNFMDLYRIGE